MVLNTHQNHFCFVFISGLRHKTYYDKLFCFVESYYSYLIRFNFARYSFGNNILCNKNSIQDMEKTLYEGKISTFAVFLPFYLALCNKVLYKHSSIPETTMTNRSIPRQHRTTSCDVTNYFLYIILVVTTIVMTSPHLIKAYAILFPNEPMIVTQELLTGE